MPATEEPETEAHDSFMPENLDSDDNCSSSPPTRTPKPVAQHKCEYCSKVFKETGKLDRHRCKGRVYRPFHACDQCDEVFKRIDRLQSHVRNKHNVKPAVTYKCDMCGWKYARLYDLNKHWNVVHVNQEQCVCDGCGMKFVDESNMVEHRKTVHAVTEQGADAAAFPCALCDMRFARRHVMLMHVQAVHDRQKPLTFDQKVKLNKRHKSTDGRAKVFPCTVCHMQFPRKSKLTAHKGLHAMTSKLRKCTMCLQTYTSKAALDEHVCPTISENNLAHFEFTSYREF